MTHKLDRRLKLVRGAVLLAGAVLAGAVASPPTTAAAGTATAATTGAAPGFADGCIGYCQHPTNAAKVFRWGVEEWRREFEDRTTSEVEGDWATEEPDLVEQREGMLTIHATSATERVTVAATDQSARYGRWEARVRAVEESTGDTPFAFVWELVPTDGIDCDANRIVLARYRPGDDRARGRVTTAPDQAFRYSRPLDLRSRAWHTYAVEVTPDHISWFVDTTVVRTERRTAALAGATFRPEFEILGRAGRLMNTSRMQMDWVRYYDLDRPNAQSIDAPRMRRVTSAPPC
ncbi:family 16 glycosylhydrolase [Nocardioides sp. MAHUQ-72]|uniref:family 16 glycosylhydrolase n=1 Tax=unclassified Nocardioides TaxID=2615069 RepID=UPI00361CA5F0